MNTMIIQSRLVCRIALMVYMCFVSSSVLAQDVYPDRPIKIIAPVGAGSVADLVPRLIAEKLAANGAIASMSRIGLAETPTSAPRPQPDPNQTGTPCSPRRRRRLQSIQVYSRS